MDREQQRIEEDLRGIVSGEVLCGAASRSLYASDASVSEVWPLAVVRPRTTDDVAATVRWAAERQIPVHPRGAGSSVAGGSLGPGVVIDCGRGRRRLLQTDGDEVRVQPGVGASARKAMEEAASAARAAWNASNFFKIIDVLDFLHKIFTRFLIGFDKETV